MRETLPFVRVSMAIASLSPLFALAAIRGLPAVCDYWLIPSMLAAVVLPNGILWLRYRIAQQRNDRSELVVESATDNREHLLVYLFAVLMPLYQNTFTNTREVVANLCAVLFVVYLFVHMQLHYMNIIFAVLDYRVFSVELKGAKVILLTTRPRLFPGDKLSPFRLSDTVYFEADSHL